MSAINNAAEAVTPGMLVLKRATPTGAKNDEGYDVYHPYEMIGEVKKGKSKAGKSFMIVHDSQENAYFISNTKKEAGPRSPSKVLTLQPKGAEGSSIVCGLFSAAYSDGTKFLKGKNKETLVKYAIFPSKGNEGSSRLTVATASDLD